MEPNQNEGETGRDAQYLEGMEGQPQQQWGGGYPSAQEDPEPPPPSVEERQSDFSHQENFYDYERGEDGPNLPEGIEAGYNPDMYTQESAYGRQTAGELDGEAEYGETRDSLANLYVRKEELGKAGENRLTIKEGLSGLQAEPKRSYKGLIVVLVLLLILAGMVAGVMTIKRPYINDNLQEVEVSFPQWAVIQLQMEPGLREFQGLSEDERAFLITRSRLYDLYPAIYDYLRATGKFPERVTEMENEGVATERLIRDGWGRLFRLDTGLDEVALVSAGPDESFRSADDIRYNGENFRAPGRFEDAEAIPFVEVE